jgi:error-prone DNA polymerase
MWRVEETVEEGLFAPAVAGDAVPGRHHAWPRIACAGDSVPSYNGCAEDGVPGYNDVPLARMTLPERVQADYETMSLTTGPHPMKLLRAELPDAWRAADLMQAGHGATVQIAGNVICRQRPGTAKGFVFISLEDETGVSNAIVTPDLFEKLRLLITEEPFLMIEGEVQNSDGVVLVKARQIKPLAHAQLAGSGSHDFH